MLPNLKLVYWNWFLELLRYHTLVDCVIKEHNSVKITKLQFIAYVILKIMLFLVTSYFKINSPTIMTVGTISQQIIFSESWKYILQTHRFNGSNSSLVLFTQYRCHLFALPFQLIIYSSYVCICLSAEPCLSNDSTRKLCVFGSAIKKHWIHDLKIWHWHKRAHSVTH